MIHNTTTGLVVAIVVTHPAGRVVRQIFLAVVVAGVVEIILKEVVEVAVIVKASGILIKVICSCFVDELRHRLLQMMTKLLVIFQNSLLAF